MTSHEYERITKSLVASIVEQVEGITPRDVGYGCTNKEKGQSGYEHQIDVSVKGARDWLLVECKKWDKGVDVERFLAFLARIIDIRPTQPSLNIHASLVSKKACQSGVEQLANYYKNIYNIQLDVVRSPTEFAIRYKHLLAMGFADDLNRWADNAQTKLEPS